MPQQPLFELNPAESILAPFHDEQNAVLLPIRALAGAATGFRHEHGWDSTKLIWDNCPVGSLAGQLTLDIAELPARFDHLIFCVVIPAGASVQFEACRNGVWHPLGESVLGTSGRIELTRPLVGGSLTGLRITVTALETGPMQLSLQWWGVGDSRLLSMLEKARPQYDGRWEGLIQPAESWGSPEFARGLLFSESDLPALREKATRSTWHGHFKKLESRARKSLDKDPLNDLGDYLPWSDYRYLREREQGREPWMAEPVLCALVGLVREDKSLIRHALHYLMCFVHTQHWCQSAESRARGSTWDQRCFLEEMATTTCALLYDWLYFALTDRARDLVRVAIWDKGVSRIQRDMVKWEYVYTMNQGPWFCRARILAGLALEKSWPRARPYTEQAFADIQEGMAHYILPDGGVDEGVGYFSVTLQAVLPALLAYARVRNRNIHDILPPRLAKSGKFVSVMSAMDPGGVLMDGDNSNDRFTGDAIAILAALYPDDVYTSMAAGTLLQLRGDTYYRQYMIDGPFAFIAAPEELPEPACIVPEFGHLPNTGQITSRRVHPGGTEVRLHLGGCKANASHTHFDKGAFTLELDREPVLIDRGMCRYDDARGVTLKRTELHNVTSPESANGVPIGQQPPEEAVIPEGNGDNVRFRASIDLSHVWRQIMTECTRKIASETPESFTVVDAGRLKSPHTVVFHLHSRRAWMIDTESRTATLETNRDRIFLHAPWATEIRQFEDGIDHRMKPVWHLECRRPIGDLRFDLATHLSIQNNT
jgi:hypothetical protein